MAIKLAEWVQILTTKPLDWSAVPGPDKVRGLN